MKSDDEFQELIDTVERQEHQAEEEIDHIRAEGRRLHRAHSMPRTMGAETFVLPVRPESEPH